MSKKSKPSIIIEVVNVMQEMFMRGFGRSKYDDKKKGLTDDKIYSYSTYDSYKKACIRFVKFCKYKYKCKTLKGCRQYVDEYLKSRFHLSASTVKLEASALAKLYQCSGTDFVKTPSRHRADIKRSRLAVERDKHFSVTKNKDLIDFCRSIGCRRKELSMLRGTDLIYRNGMPFIHFTRGTKGGRERYTPVIGNVELVVNMMNKAGNNKIFTKISSNADIHSYRADYAKSLYNMLARPINQIPYDRVNKGTGRKYQSEVYVCRGDKKGIKYDRRAMLEVSRALGHNRVSVIASNYLY